VTGRLEEVLGVDVPIVLGPFGGLSSVELTAVVSIAGGLGSYGLYEYDTARIRSAVDQLRAATGRPFALNLWLATGDENKPRDCDLGSLVRPLVPLFSELGLEPPTSLPDRFLPDLNEQIDAVIEARPRVLSFVYGVPAPPKCVKYTCRRVGQQL